MDIHQELSMLSAKDAAHRLIGCVIERTVAGNLLKGRIVETEAYDQSDIASHSYRGMTPRNSVMFEQGGMAYVYFTYGMHYCMNVVVGIEGIGAAVLIRALEPLEGIEYMALHRKTTDVLNLCSGPAKLTQALNIDRSLNGHDLASEPLRLVMSDSLPVSLITWRERIGIREEPGKELMWRAGLKGSKYLSRPL